MSSALMFNHHMSPKLEDVKNYFSTRGVGEKEAEDFFHVYEYRQWKSKKGDLIVNWKTIAYRWIVSVWKADTVIPEKQLA